MSAVLYKTVKDKRTGGTGLYYGRAVQLNTVDTDALAYSGRYPFTNSGDIRSLG